MLVRSTQHIVIAVLALSVLVTACAVLFIASQPPPSYGRPVRCSYTRSAQQDEFAYVTFLATMNYVPGLVTLLNSIFQSGTPHSIVVMVKAEIFDAAKQQLSVFSKKCSWNISRVIIQELPFRKVIFIDADSVVLENIDDLFLLPGAIAGVQASADSVDDINSGLLVMSPCEALFEDMVEKLDEMKWNPEHTQKYFVYYFGAHEILWLPRKYNTRRPQGHPLFGAAVIHYTNEPKPWQQNDPTDPWIATWHRFAQCMTTV